MSSYDPYRVLRVDPQADEAELRAAWRRQARQVHPDAGGDQRAMQDLNAALEQALAALGRRTPAPAAEPSRHHVERDQPSFVIELLPAEAFEALVVVTGWIGEVLVEEPPYLLEVHLSRPADTWCRLELVPDAGASTVTLTVDGPLTAEQARDLWVEQLNQLGAWDPEG